MKKYLLPESGKFYKANLHSHSTVSDGNLSPEEMKKEYMEKGYSIIAYTDHDVLVPHPELKSDNFLPLNGIELEVNENYNAPFYGVKTCHICFIALKPDNITQFCYHRSKYIWGNAESYRDKLVFDETLPDFEREYTPECISEMMRIGREKGFFVTYNHPGWSMEEKEQYCNYHNMHAMEICNYGCLIAGYTDYNDRVYDEMLKNGERIFCIATDDNHNCADKASRHYDSFGGFTMIKAEKLEYEAVTDALVKGNFYASQGPEIYDLWFEDGKIHVTCSDADRIVLNTGRRRTAIELSENGKPLNSAEFEIFPEDKYVRITVIDKGGYPANTNAYFTDELL